MESLQRSPNAAPSPGSSDRPSLQRCERSSPLKEPDARNRHVRDCEGWGWQHPHLLGSGEGLIYAIRDGSDDEVDGDPGVKDKRLLVVEQELGAALRAFQRTGNNLSMILRRAFDGDSVSRQRSRSPRAI